ncbi:MAG: cupin domain-containing protein [Bacteroidales bacterium]|nr:cupin domain-containing protein [Bacteroidales bacterium]
MKKYLSIAILMSFATIAPAQENLQQGALASNANKSFTTVMELPITSVKNQHRSGTCWDFGTLGFLESEILRKTGKTYDLCEMFVVNKDYMDNATHYVRMHGYSQISEGGSADDVIEVIKNYGICPEEAMPAPGSLTGDSLANFKVFFPELEKLVSSFVTKDAKEPSDPDWKNKVQALIDKNVGAVPRWFEYEGKRYTPKNFAASLGLDLDEYVSLTSYTHHPFNEWFVIEAPYKWRLKPSYNIPIDQLMDVLDHALDEGYTVAWGGDVTGDFTRTGLAMLPDGVVPTQQTRQQQWDSWQFTYDHVMLIYGKALDENGKPYYKVKNSWGRSGQYDGTWYMSRDFIALNTTYIFLNRNALPTDKDNYNMRALQQKKPYYKVFSKYDVIPNGNGWSYWYIPTEVADTLNIKVSELNKVMASHEPHQHDHHEYFLILEGDVNCYMNGEETLLHPGDGFMCPGESMHALRRTSADQPASYMMFTLETPGGLGFTPPYFKKDYKPADCYVPFSKKKSFWYLKPSQTLGGLNIQSLRIKKGRIKKDRADGRQLAYVILEGTAEVTIDGVPVELPAPAVGYVPAGGSGSVKALTDNVRFLKVRTH